MSDYVKITKKNQTSNIKIVKEEILEKKTITIDKSGNQTSSRLIKMTENEAKDPTFILEAHGYDPDKWVIFSSTSSEWEVQRKGGSIETLYASKITVKPRVKEISPEDIYKELLKMPTNHTPSTGKNKIIVDEDPHMLEIALQDLHIGKLAWYKETGEEYNYKIAMDRAKSAVRNILNRAKGRNIEKILFLLGGDTYHSDNANKQTTYGTNVESDITWQQMFLEGTKLLIDLVNEMLEIAPVDVITILGNHSTVTEMHSQLYLSAWFRNDPRVNIDLKMTPRKYYEYGKCLIGFTHGDKESKRISGLMQVEQPQAWGRSLFREIHAGHLHSEQTKEENGIIIRNISSISGTDGWHAQKGFVGAQKKLQSFLWNKNNGLVEIWNSPIINKPVRKNPVKKPVKKVSTYNKDNGMEF